MPDIFDQVALKSAAGDTSEGDVFDQAGPRLTPEQLAAKRLSPIPISPSGLVAPVIPLRTDSLAPRRTRDFSTGRPVERAVPRTTVTGGMEESTAPKLVRSTINTALPALGGMGGTALASPTVAGTALGAGLGTALGVSGAHLANTLIFGDEMSLGDQAKDIALQSGEAALTGGLMAGLSGAPLTRVKPAAPMQVFGPSEQWGEMNETIGAKGSQIRISNKAQDIGEAATNPGRGLVKEGFDASTFKQMTPLERMAAIKPKYDAAGKAIDDLVSKATDAGKVVDVGKTATDTLGRILDPKLQERAIDSFNGLAKELGIKNLRTATPEEALQLRRALGGGARFGPNGDLSSLAGVRAALYRSVNTDLRGVVQDLQPLDEHFSDLKGAIDAVQNQVGKAAVKAPLPLPAGPSPGPGLLNQAGRTIAQQGGRMLVRKALPYVVGGAGTGALGNALYEGLRKRFLP